MQSLLAQIKTHIAAAITTGLGDDAREVDPQVHPARDPKLGDYQCNAAMGLAKLHGLLVDKVQTEIKPQDMDSAALDAELQSVREELARLETIH